MAKIQYETHTFRAAALAIIDTADQICRDYAAQGYSLTLRQLYYQFVSRDEIPNTQQSYKRLGDIINNARLAGLLDWDHIVDRTRNLRGTSHWSRPGDVIDSAAWSYRLDKWKNQPRRVEIWVEKEALAEVVQRAAGTWDLDWFSCRGYVSQSELHGAGKRHARYVRAGQRVTVLHLGDHDPSGIDMTRDIADRLRLFSRYGVAQVDADGPSDHWAEIEVRRIALTYDQVQQYSPPPNPAKLTDSRADGYISQYGPESWELDALDVTQLAGLIDRHVTQIVDMDRYTAIQDQETSERDQLMTAARRWSDVTTFLNDNPDD